MNHHAPLRSREKWTASTQAGRVKSPGRLAVEKVLRGAAQPVSIALIVERANIDPEMARRHVHNACINNVIHNANAGRVPALYAWGPAAAAPRPADRPAGTPTVAAPRERQIGAGAYQGDELQPFTGRPGAMVAFELPSLIDGREVERQRPALISSKLRERI